MNYCKDCKHCVGPKNHQLCFGAARQTERIDLVSGPVQGIGGVISCRESRSESGPCGPEGLLFAYPPVEPRFTWSPVRFWRQLVAFREWQNQLAAYERAGGNPTLLRRLALEAEQRYRELCK